MSATDPNLSWFRSGPTGLTVRIIDSPRAAASLARAELEAVLARTAHPKVGLATGKTFAPVFSHWVESAWNAGLEFHRCILTHLDEYHGFGSGRPGSMADELRAGLLDLLPRPPRAFHPVPGYGPIDVAVTGHGEQLKALGPLHLQFLGLGSNGHIAFNEPGTPFGVRHQASALTRETLAANQERFGGGTIPTHGITAGPAAIATSERLVLFAFGPHKAEAVKRLLEGPIHPDCPATLLRLHPNASLVLDRAAASLITPRALRTPEPVAAWTGPARSFRPNGPVLVCAPHPDDAAISCGGFLASLPAEVRRVLLTVTTGARARVPGVSDPHEIALLREDEVRREARHFHAETEFLRARGYDSHAFEPTDAEALERAFDAIRPAIVIAPARDDGHATHRLARALVDTAAARHTERQGRELEVWSFEGPWHLHRREEINAVLVLDSGAEATKLAALREHRSQLVRVPFDEGAIALARLRGIALSESHFGGTEPGRMNSTPVLECFVRERWRPLSG